MFNDCLELVSTLVRELDWSKNESKQVLPMHVARVDEAVLLPAKTRAAACERLNVRPLKKVVLGTTVMLPLRTMLFEGGKWVRGLNLH